MKGIQFILLILSTALSVNATSLPGYAQEDTVVFKGATSGDISYKSVPEPLTILGSATALGFGVLFKRENSKKSKKS
jgi:hypothetical protein